jgi:hypothetical protein
VRPMLVSCSINLARTKLLDSTTFPANERPLLRAYAQVHRSPRNESFWEKPVNVQRVSRSEMLKAGTDSSSESNRAVRRR